MGLSIIGVCNKYGVDRKIIRKTIAMNPDFPIGDSNFAKMYYNFDPDELDEWLKTHRWSGSPNPLKVVVPPHQNPLPPSIQQYVEKERGKGDKAAVQTALLQLELDKKRGRLVDRDDVISHFAPRIAMLAKGLEMIPNLIGKKHGLHDSVIRDIRDQMDRLRENLTRCLKDGVMADDFVLVDDDE